MRIVAYVPNLMDRSRLAPVAADSVFVASVNELAGVVRPGDVVVVDLGRPGVVDAVAPLVDSDASRVVGFVEHENTELIHDAKNRGIEVMRRSAFFSRIAVIFTQEGA